MCSIPKDVRKRQNARSDLKFKNLLLVLPKCFFAKSNNKWTAHLCYL